ncbi:hypothetical protein ACLQ24_30080, partial [Micromonospora sp. DT4]|uniref:hypothetical protein n=1 Tax=Micromonospora sp. DT4 TaxID=3393438 RepID=UPI003CF86930
MRELGDKAASLLRLLINKRGTDNEFVTHAEVKSVYTGPITPGTAIAHVREALKKTKGLEKDSWEIKSVGHGEGWRLVGLWNVQVESGGAEASVSSAAAGQDVDAPGQANAPLDSLGTVNVDAVGDYGFNDEMGPGVGLAGGGLWGNWLPTAEGMSAAIGA